MSEKHEFVKAVVTYQSGREEVVTAKLLKGGNHPKPFAQKISDLRAFPTVTDVKVSTY